MISPKWYGFRSIDVKGRLEAEIWTRPDGVVFDEELLRRRVRVRPFNDSFEMFVIGPEDFIVNKLARKDRGVQDEQDALSVLALQQDKLDYAYLRKRAKNACVDRLLDTLMQKIRNLNLLTCCYFSSQPSC